MSASRPTLLLLLFAFVAVAYGSSERPGQKAESAGSNVPGDEVSTMDYMNMPLITITGDTTTLARLSGRAYLLVNVASKCGFTPQYEGLEDLYLKFKDSGLVVVGFPANNFGNQEPGTNEEIKAFCESKFDVTFPMMSKISVKGKDKHPLYVYLTEKSSKPGEIEWNFTKFLVKPDGKVVARFPSATTPMSDEVLEAVRRAL